MILQIEKRIENYNFSKDKAISKKKVKHFLSIFLAFLCHVFCFTNIQCGSNRSRRNINNSLRIRFNVLGMLKKGLKQSVSALLIIIFSRFPEW